ncbi:MAG TPA: CDP-alcohol phosphatidyltransferase family protein [Elusimicrobiota bacterium]|jgi:phosphatidylglycerophosphate synthase|nr:CDP-alcohol phosphatidyltransferase family protein [Elusimicrobiota bacterium]
MTAPSPRRLQVLLRARPGDPLVAGLPCAVRAAYRAGRELAPERIVIAGADPDYLGRWAFQFRAAGAPVVSDRFGAGALAAGLPLLAVEGDAFPDAGGLADFAASAEGTGAARRELNGRAVAVYARDAGAFGAGTSSPSDVHARALAGAAETSRAGAFLDAGTPGEADRSASILYGRMAKPNDGYIARFDRRLSVAITRLMLPFPISPNQVTAASLLLGFLGAWWLASASAQAQFEGALLLWFCALLDGCDGEIARLKHHVTAWGGEFDLLADHVAHLATFIALPIGVARLHPDQNWWIPGVLLVTGFLASGFSVWWLVLRVPEEKRGPTALLVERIASRDYVYLIVALTAIGRLNWFVWTAAYGSHVFWAWLWWSARRSPAAA